MQNAIKNKNKIEMKIDNVEPKGQSATERRQQRKSNEMREENIPKAQQQQKKH